VLCLATLLGLPHLALAQRVTGQIQGIVTDASGAVLPGVTVAIKGPAIVGSQTSTTNERGFYRVAALPPGVYTVSFTLSGFSTLNREGIRAGVGQTTEENVSLKLSTLEEQVTVTGEGGVVDTTSAQIGTNYDKDWVRNAPVPRFTFFDLINAAPGVNQAQTGDSRSTSLGSAGNENSYQLRKKWKITDRAWPGLGRPRRSSPNETINKRITVSLGDDEVCRRRIQEHGRRRRVRVHTLGRKARGSHECIDQRAWDTGAVVVQAEGKAISCERHLN
jgi:hypothetical protein